MRKNILIIGIVLLVVGAALSGGAMLVAAHEAPNSINGAGTTMHSSQNGIFYSNPLNSSTGSEIIVVSNVHSYLVTLTDLSYVNVSNVGSYAVAPTLTAGNTSTYSNLNGSFYIVAFGTTSPKVNYAVINGGIGHLVISGLLLIIGVLIAIVGIILAIIGAILKPKNQPVRPF